jgi:hypothetical protein
MSLGVGYIVEQDASTDYTTPLAPDCSSCVSNELQGKEICRIGHYSRYPDDLP